LIVRGSASKQLFRAAIFILAVILLPLNSNAQIKQDHKPKLSKLIGGLHWAGVSNLIGYRGKLWFCNSVKFVNHNSADLYSFDPGTGRTRYEKHIFSQDAGHPVIKDGLLYWPFEDSRFSPGHGEFMVTNGTEWNWHLIPKGRAFHTHVMHADANRLYAGISAWVAKIVVSEDGGTSWKKFYEYPTPDGRVSRITAMAHMNGTLFAGVTTWYDKTQPKLLMRSGNEFAPVPGWPAGASVDELAVYKGWLYAANEGTEESVLWRTNGKKTERVGGPSGLVNAFAVGDKFLWAVTARKGSGALWRSKDGLLWEEVQKFEHARPLDVAVFDAQIYVGLLSEKGGELWGTAKRRAVKFDPAPIALPPKVKIPAAEVEVALKQLDTVLSDTTRYRSLRFAMRPLVAGQSLNLGTQLIKRLDGPFPRGAARMFGRRLIPTSNMAEWYLLWGIAHNGAGKIPLHYLTTPWTSKPNGAEKYIQPALAAIWAVRELNQKDNATIGALVDRLSFEDDPKWVTGDVIGALTDLTGKRFGYDRDAWRKWWKTVN
tara:strand:+ start:30654 stop:32279 length:1626 start_codon:yes stop_codon:yes gene_type:complete